MTIQKNNGIGLIEVLVALAIMAAGLLAIASFQGSLLSESSANKTRAEAIAIAQQRIEQIRNYSGEAFNLDDFNLLYADISAGNLTEVDGNNATFNRTETIFEANDAKGVSVTVAWLDATGKSQSVNLETDISWASPSLSGELDNAQNQEILVRSATGRAELGDGKVGDNEQSTGILGDLIGVIDRGDGDLRLVKGDDIVLTLKDACLLDDEGARTEIPCTDFVEISGRVFIDTVTNPTNPTDVYIIASDAAYCQRYYFTNQYDEFGDLISSDVPSDIADVNVSDLATPNGDYSYYNYTCYLGGGWHGNIGLIVTAKNNSQDTVKACLGDPSSADAFADPEVAIRRVYRGMAFKYTDASETEIIKDAQNEILYYSVGVADALKLPDPAAETKAPHDFVVASIASNDGSECIDGGIMVGVDAGVNGELLFAGNPTSFFCLNQNPLYVDKIKLDALGYSTNEVCPFDPSDPPNQRHVISGEIVITADISLGESVNATTINTSDGPLNCNYSNYGYADGIFTIAYSCDVYQWTNPWGGYLQINPDLTEFSCTKYRDYLSGIVGDTNGINFNCATNVDDSEYGNILVTGTNTAGVSAISIVGTISDGSSDDQAYCQPTISPSFTCVTDNFKIIDTWSGSITLTGSKLCVAVTASSGTVTVTENTGSTKSTTIDIANASPGTIVVKITEESTGNVKCP